MRWAWCSKTSQPTQVLRPEDHHFRVRPLNLRHRGFLANGSGWLMSASASDIRLWPLSFVFYVPLFVACRGQSVRQVLFLGEVLVRVDPLGHAASDECVQVASDLGASGMVTETWTFDGLYAGIGNAVGTPFRDHVQRGHPVVRGDWRATTVQHLTLKPDESWVTWRTRNRWLSYGRRRERSDHRG